MIRKLVTRAALCLVAAIAGPAGAAPAATPWGAGYFTNVPLLTQDGQTVNFYEDLLKGKKVLVNFIFTSCEQACPLDTANMARLQQLLGDRVGKDVFMYSITLDPEHDTPAVLKAYAEKFGAGPGWLFLSGQRADIDAVRFKLGDRSAKEEHANTVRIGDVASGRWMRLPLNADPNYLMIEVNNTFFPDWSAGKTLKSIAEAPRPEVFGPGQLLFANRCAACHTLGKGDHLGPDLQAVTTRRERGWLVRYLAAPDKLRAARDPIALALADKYKLPMPNLSLTRKELGELIEYLEAQRPPPADSAVAAAAAGDGHEHHQHHHH